VNWLALLGPLLRLLRPMWAPLAGYFKGRRDARAAQQLKDLKDAAKRTDAGRQALQRGRDSGASPDQRLRNNDGRWR